MRKYSFFFFIKQSISGLVKNGLMTSTSIFILMSCLILMGCFTLLLTNINLNLQQIDTLNKIVFFVDQEYGTPEALQQIEEKIKTLENTKFVKLVTKEEALKKVKSKFGKEYEDLFDEASEKNKIRNSFEIEYKDIEKVDTFIYQLTNITGVSKINNKTQIADLIKNLKNIVMLVMFWFLIVLFIISIFIILNTIRQTVNTRKNEIKIMRYIGATNFFILFPFLLEGIIIGIISAVIAYFVQWYLYNLAAVNIIKMQTGLSIISFNEVNILVFISFIFIGVASGLIGSGISSRKYLSV